jgi:small-conductance mechanosensitive channel
LSLALTQLGLAWRGIVREDRTEHIGGKNGLDDIGESPSGADNDPVLQKILVTPDIARQRVITICCWIVGFFIGIWFLGFKLGSLFLTFIFLKFTANEKWMLSITIATATYLFFWLVFDITLKAPLDSGFVGDYFGLNW